MPVNWGGYCTRNVWLLCFVPFYGLYSSIRNCGPFRSSVMFRPAVRIDTRDNIFSHLESVSCGSNAWLCSCMVAAGRLCHWIRLLAVKYPFENKGCRVVAKRFASKIDPSCKNFAAKTGASSNNMDYLIFNHSLPSNDSSIVFTLMPRFVVFFSGRRLSRKP